MTFRGPRRRRGKRAPQALRVRFSQEGELKAALKSLGAFLPRAPFGGAAWNALRVETRRHSTRPVAARRESRHKTKSDGRRRRDPPGCDAPTVPYIPSSRCSTIRRHFRRSGLFRRLGPRWRTIFHNFEASNSAPSSVSGHAGSLSISGRGLLLRTHSSPVQVRVHASQGRRSASYCPDGSTARQRSHPLSHVPSAGGTSRREDVSGADTSLSRVFSTASFAVPSARYPPASSPFTAPSMEWTCDVSPVRAQPPLPTAREGWLEVMGLAWSSQRPSQRPHRPGKVHGFAWGMGLDRIAMLKYGLDDLRVLFQGDAAFLASGGVL